MNELHLLIRLYLKPTMSTSCVLRFQHILFKNVINAVARRGGQITTETDFPCKCLHSLMNASLMSLGWVTGICHLPWISVYVLSVQSRMGGGIACSIRVEEKYVNIMDKFFSISIEATKTKMGFGVNKPQTVSLSVYDYIRFWPLKAIIFIHYIFNQKHKNKTKKIRKRKKKQHNRNNRNNFPSLTKAIHCFNNNN